MREKTIFYSPTLKKPFGFDVLINEIISYIQEEPKSEYKIVIGTDSPGVGDPFFVTAITILRVGNGGRYFWTKSRKISCFSLQERIYKEAMHSITLIQEIKDRLKEKMGEDFLWDKNLSVHIDIGRRGRTKDLIESVTGMVKGHGFKAVIKPDAFGACVVADRYT